MNTEIQEQQKDIYTIGMNGYGMFRISILRHTTHITESIIIDFKTRKEATAHMKKNHAGVTLVSKTVFYAEGRARDYQVFHKQYGRHYND